MKPFKKFFNETMQNLQVLIRKEKAEIEEELDVNKAVQDINEEGPLSRDRRQNIQKLGQYQSLDDLDKKLEQSKVEDDKEED